MNPEPRDYVLGLDLGKRRDPSALVINERTLRHVPGRGLVKHHAIRFLRRWPLGTDYLSIARDLVKMVSKPPLQGSLIAADETGVGLPVLEVVRAEKPDAVLKPILITGGHAVTFENGSWHVAKEILVSTVVALLQSRRLRFAAVPERETLIKELVAFRVKYTDAANETYESLRERDHDDLVLATCLACWLGEREPIRGAARTPLKLPGLPQSYGNGEMRGVGTCPARPIPGAF